MTDAVRFAPTFTEVVRTDGPSLNYSPRDHIHALIGDIARKHQMTYDAVMRKDRHRSVVSARCEAIRTVAAQYPRLSYPELGRIFGMDHTTILHHLDKTGQGRNTCRCGR